MTRNFFSTPNVMGRLMIVLLFAGGVVFAGAFDGFVVETEASSCCGGGTDAALFSSSECCDEDECQLCGCYIAGCSNCTMLGCGSNASGQCGCGKGDGGPGGQVPDGCTSKCSTSTDDTELCNNDCGY